MLRAFLLVTGIISFLYFLFPSLFAKVNPDKDVLGVSKINAYVNKSSLETALLAYCLSEQSLPKSLNELYAGYLSEKRKLDLDKLFKYKVVSRDDCEYELNSI